MRRNRLLPFILGIIILVLCFFMINILTGPGEEPADPGQTDNGQVETPEDPVDPGDTPEAEPEGDPEDDTEYIVYTFRNARLLREHFEKHGIEMGFDSEEEYEMAASDVANDPDALHKLEKDDGDDVYYKEDTNEFVVISRDGYIRTYFCPDSGKKYFDKQ